VASVVLYVSPVFIELVDRTVMILPQFFVTSSFMKEGASADDMKL